MIMMIMIIWGCHCNLMMVAMMIKIIIITIIIDHDEPDVISMTLVYALIMVIMTETFIIYETQYRIWGLESGVEGAKGGGGGPRAAGVTYVASVITF